MVKRKFSPQRLYRLCRLLVIVISILLMILAFSQYKQSLYFKGELQKITEEQASRVFPKGYEQKDKEEVGKLRKIKVQDNKTGQTISFAWIGKEDPTEKELQEVFKQFRIDDSNIRFFMTFQSELINNFRLLAGIAVVLPAIFYIGVGLYRYLFPILRED